MPGVTAMQGLTDGAEVSGMSGTISVTGDVPTTPAPVIDPFSTIGEMDGAAALIEAAKATWNADAVAVTVDYVDNGDAHFIKPKVIELKLNQPVILTFANKGITMHVFETPDFLATCAFWKVVNAEGSVYGGKVKPADLEAGGAASLYIIPTKVGTYALGDEAPELSMMKATIVVKK
jgi:hypothetical protein